jgi:hypothetical protein
MHIASMIRIDEGSDIEVARILLVRPVRLFFVHRGTHSILLFFSAPVHCKLNYFVLRIHICSYIPKPFVEVVLYDYACDSPLPCTLQTANNTLDWLDIYGIRNTVNQILI